MQQIADHTTNCRDAWFHTQTRLAPGEQLTRGHWERVLDREEKRLGFSGHARAWSFHIDEATGERHLHAAWFRIDPETNRAHDPGLFKLRLMEVARWAEKEFGLRELSNERQPHDKARAPERNERKNPAASAPMSGRSAPPFSIASNAPTAARHSRPRSKNAA